MKKILIVDNDSVTCRLLERALTDSSDDFEIVTAGNGSDALDIVTAHDISLVLMELDLPGMDGFQLFSSIQDHHPHIHVFVMTAFSTDETRSKVDAIGRAVFFEKPLDVELLSTRIVEELNSGIEGRINGISLPSYLQTMEAEKRTCTVNIASGEKTGRLVFVDGRVVNARTGVMRNEEAAYEIMGWKGTDVSIKNGCRVKTGTIDKPLKQIFMEGLKKRGKASNPSVRTAKSANALTRLTNRLKGTRGIIEYAIFNDRGKLTARHSISGKVLKCRSRVYVKCAEQINEMVKGGNLRYIVLKMENDIRYIMFTCHNRGVAIAVEQGFKADDIIRRLSI